MTTQARLYGRQGPFVRNLLPRHEEFHAGAMRAEREVYASETGRLPEEFRTDYIRQSPEPHRYVVFSYGTPIAWVTSDGTLHIPDTRYSSTTSRHQSLCRTYLTADARPSYIGW